MKHFSLVAVDGAVVPQNAIDALELYTVKDSPVAGRWASFMTYNGAPIHEPDSGTWTRTDDDATSYAFDIVRAGTPRPWGTATYVPDAPYLVLANADGHTYTFVERE